MRLALHMNEMLIACVKSAESFAKHIGALDTYVAEGKKSVHFNIITRLSRLEFVYSTKSMGLICPKSTLFVRLFPQKNQSFYLHLPEIMADSDFRCTCFSWIESAERMEACFGTLAGLVEEYLPVLESLAIDGASYAELLAEKQHAILEYANIKEETIPTAPEEQELFWSAWQDFYESYAYLAYFTNYIGYTAFLSGDLEKARRIYEKRESAGNLNSFERRLLVFLKDSKSQDYCPIPASCSAILENRYYSNGAEEGKLLLLTGGICYGIALVIEWFIIGLAYLIYGFGTEYYPIDWVFACILPLLPATFGSIGLRRLFMPLLFKNKKDIERIRNIDSLANGRITVVAWVLTGLLTLVFIFFSFVFSASTPRFYTDRLIYDDAASFPLPNGAVYEYEDVECVCYIEGRWNAYGELVARSSYIVIFKDGRYIDLDGVLTLEQTEDRFLPLLKPYVSGDVKIFASEKELIKAYELSQATLITW